MEHVTVLRKENRLIGESPQPSDTVSGGNQPNGNGHTFAVAFLIGFAIVCPTFFIEEFWHGRPLIDQGGHRWVLPAIVMGLGFFVGGLIVGRRRRDVWNAFGHGLLVAAVIVGVTFIADLIRRDALGQVLTSSVEYLWFGAAALAIAVGGLGGVVGYRHMLSHHDT